MNELNYKYFVSYKQPKQKKIKKNINFLLTNLTFMNTSSFSQMHFIFSSAKWLYKCIIILALTILSVQRETKILQYLNEADKNTLILAKELIPMFESNRRLDRQFYRCLTMLPGKLVESGQERSQPLNVSQTKFKYKPKKKVIPTNEQKKQETIKIDSTVSAGDGRTTGKEIIGSYQDYNYDKILDLLHGSCAIFETNQFLYEYCHKEKVRQFDNFDTYSRMAKTQFEDIAMGYYDYQKVIQNSQKEEDLMIKQPSQIYQLMYQEDGSLNILDALIQSEAFNQAQREALKDSLQDFKQNLKKKNNQNKKPKNQKAAKVQVKTLTMPIRSAIYNSKNLFTASATNSREFAFEREIGLIRLNYPLETSNQYFVSSEKVIALHCNGMNKNEQYFTHGRVISPFEIVFLGDQSKCLQLTKVDYRSVVDMKFDTPPEMQKIRGTQNYLYGQIDEVCTNNWAWSEEAPSSLNLVPDMGNSITQGTTLLLEIAQNKSGVLSFSNFPVEVVEIIARGAVRLREDIDEALIDQDRFKPKRQVQFSKRWISGCRMISKKPIISDSYTLNNQFLDKNIIKIQQGENGVYRKSGDQLLCLCSFVKYKEDLLEVQLTLGNEIFSLPQQGSSEQKVSYYQLYTKKTVKTLTIFNKKLHEVCKSIICYDTVKDEEISTQEQVQNQQKTITKTNKASTQTSHQSQPIPTTPTTPSTSTQTQKATSQSTFTSVFKLTPDHPKLKISPADSQFSFDPKLQSNIFLIDISKNGLVKIHTQGGTSAQPLLFTYILTRTNIVKILTHRNNTKQIVLENRFYVNETYAYEQSWLMNSIMVHKGHIWRYNDKLIYPRMKMAKDQLVMDIELCGVGFAYVRKWDLEKMKSKKAFMASNIQEFIQQHYMVKKYPIYDNENEKDRNDKNVDNGKKAIEKQVVNQDRKNDRREQDNEKNKKSFTTQQQQIYSQQQKIKQQIQQFQPYHKPLNRSVGLKYQYYHGDYCGGDINKNRRTNVHIECGQSWFSIASVQEKSPCVYSMYVKTLLLCSEKYKKTISTFDEIKLPKGSRFGLGKDTICYLQDSWDQVKYMYYLDESDVLFAKRE